MANEIQVQLSATVKNANLAWRGFPTSYRANMISNSYPVPGAAQAANRQYGIAIDLSFFDDANPVIVPGLVWMQNLDPFNNIEYGVYDPGTETFFGTGSRHDEWFYPLGMILPGQIVLWYLSPNVRWPNLTLSVRASDPTSTPGHWVAAGAPANLAVAIFGV